MVRGLICPSREPSPAPFYAPAIEPPLPLEPPLHFYVR